MPEIRFAEQEKDVADCFGLMRQLRPHLGTPEEFVERWAKQHVHDYHLLVLWEATTPVALAGFRFQENLLHGPHVYVDDLVTCNAYRSKGYGQRLLDRLKTEARARGLRTLVLDAAIGNALGHRFYFKNGSLARGLHFWMELDEVQNVG